LLPLPWRRRAGVRGIKRIRIDETKSEKKIIDKIIIGNNRSRRSGNRK